MRIENLRELVPYDRPVLIHGESLPSDAGGLPTRLTMLLDGSRVLEEIVGELVADEYPLDHVIAEMSRLHSQGRLDEGNPDVRGLAPARHSEQIRALQVLAESVPTLGSRSPIAGLQAQLALSRQTVVMVTDGVIESLLRQLPDYVGVGRTIVDDHQGSDIARETEMLGGIRAQRATARAADLLEDSPNSSLGIVVYAPQSFDEALCETLNEFCVESLVPFLPYRATLSQVELGPLVMPRETACYACYQRRRMAGSDAREVADERRAARHPYAFRSVSTY